MAARSKDRGRWLRCGLGHMKPTLLLAFLALGGTLGAQG